MEKKKVIAFSLWGNAPTYTIGALKNVQLAARLYPGWICRFYVGSSTPSNVTDALSLYDNVEVVKSDNHGDWRASVWRFLPAADETVEVMISRDTDSRLSERERAAVDDWLTTDKLFHIMRDHPLHSLWPILAGMWGVRGGLLRNIESLLESDFLHSFKEYKWGVDQMFLGRTIHPLVRAITLVHDDLSPVLSWDAMSVRRRFPTPRRNLEFVGQVFDEKDRTPGEHVVSLIARLQVSK